MDSKQKVYARDGKDMKGKEIRPEEECGDKKKEDKE